MSPEIMSSNVIARCFAVGITKNFTFKIGARLACISSYKNGRRHESQKKKNELISRRQVDGKLKKPGNCTSKEEALHCKKAEHRLAKEMLV